MKKSFAALLSFIAACQLPFEAVASRVDRRINNGADNSVVQGLQAAMAMSAMMPDEPEVQKPDKNATDVMDKASPLVFSAYDMLQSAEQNLEVAEQQLKMKMHVENAAAGIANGKGLLEEAKKKLQAGKQLANQAVSMFQNNADPLGPPPQNPKEWDEINSSVSRAEGKVGLLDDTLEEVQRFAKDAGISDHVTTASKGFSIEREQSQAFSK